MPPAPRCNSPISGRTSRRSDKGPRLYSARSARKHGYTVEDLLRLEENARFRGVPARSGRRGRDLFREGLPLDRNVDRRLALDLDLFSRGGMKVSTKDQDAGLRCATAAPAYFEDGARRDPSPMPSPASSGLMSSAVGESYRYCEQIARSAPRISTIRFCCSKDRSARPCARSTPSCAIATI